MSAFVISEVKILDETAADHYRKLAAASIEQYGGTYLVRGAVPEVVEGSATDKRIVIVAFPSSEQLRAWYVSPEYAEALRYRATALERRLLFVEGLATE